MKPISQYISVMLATLFGVALTSCTSDVDSPAETSKMSISFRVETRNGDEPVGSEESGTSAAGYEDANAWENYIDIDNDDYRIVFFDMGNRCITTFTPDEIEAEDVSNYKEYTLKGEVPAILTMYPDFKIVVLANWGKYNYPIIKSGSTTIDDICCPHEGSLGRFRHFEPEEYKIEEGQRYVPMYGVKEYKGLVFGRDDKDNPTILYQGNFGPVNMLRAVAKVEVIFDTEDHIELDTDNEIYITNYNDYGYCAPEGAYKESDYFHSYDWDLDYWQGRLHLVGGQNDTGVPKPIKMKKLTRDDDKNVWVAYLPEYRNIALTDNKKDCTKSDVDAASQNALNKARIAVPHIQREVPKTSYLDFATYTGGEPDTYINIERNNLYRFTITHVDQGLKWKVEALPWKGYVHEGIVM